LATDGAKTDPRATCPQQPLYALHITALLNDGYDQMALGVNPAEWGVTELRPRSKPEGIFNALILTRYLVGGADYMFATIAGAY
jgi:hypothetical protein